MIKWQFHNDLVNWDIYYTIAHMYCKIDVNDLDFQPDKKHVGSYWPETFSSLSWMQIIKEELTTAQVDSIAMVEPCKIRMVTWSLPYCFAL